MAIYYFAYTAGLDDIHKKEVDLVDDDIRVILVKSAHVPSASHQWLSDIAAGDRIDSAVALTSKTFSGLVFSHAAIVFPSVTAALVAGGIVYYKHTGTEGTSRLLFFNSAIRDFPYNTNGEDITINPPASGVYQAVQRGALP
jgi:hypothetical protein